MKKINKYLLTVVMGIAVSGVVYAATQSFNAPVRFIQPLSFASATDPNMGDWYSGAASRGIGIDTTAAATGTNSADYVAGASVGSVDILGSASRTISIVANNFANGGGKVDITGVPCSWNGGAETACDGAGITGASTTPVGHTLLLGVSATTNAVTVDGDTATPTFDIVVSYE